MNRPTTDADDPQLELETVALRGTPRDMGRQFGEATRDQVRELYERRVAAAVRFAGEVTGQPPSVRAMVELASRCLPTMRAYDPQGYEEFRGIAEGASISPARLLIMQGLTDLRDILAFSGLVDSEGCSSVILLGSRTDDGGPLLAQTWDLETDNMPYVRLVHRRPNDGGPETWSLTLTGCLSLIGLNSEGIAIGTTNLQSRDARLGVMYLSIIHRALRARSFAESVAAVRDAPRAAAHYYLIADASGQAVGLECSAERSVALEPVGGALTHCNHCLSPPMIEIEAPILRPSTQHRHDRLSSLIEQHPGPIGVDTVRRFFADHEGGDLAICRHDVPPRNTSTNACVIIAPAKRTLHACRGQSHVGAWRSVEVGASGPAGGGAGDKRLSQPPSGPRLP